MSLRILIVEDEPVIALHLQLIFEDADHLVVGIAGDMRRALQFAEARPGIDLATMDVKLGGGTNGIDTARLLRTRHGIASLFVCSQPTREMRERVAESNPVGFVGKPFDDKQILEAIASVEERDPSIH